MNDTKIIQWILRIAVAGEFAGHGLFAIGGKEDWIPWVQQFTGADVVLAKQLLFIVGVMDLLVAFIVLVRPIKIVLLWAAFWGFWTALVRPLTGGFDLDHMLDFIERFANWGAPLALFFLLKRQKDSKDS
ncbi:MAG: hypothetical protein AAB890_00690 [Patescibacteria group bacterium]